MRRIEDLADSPLVPALLEKVHLETDSTLLTVSASTYPCQFATATDSDGCELISNLVQGGGQVPRDAAAVPARAHREPDRAGPDHVRRRFF